MAENPPVWEDESFAGTLFPHARPMPTLHIMAADSTGDGGSLGTVAEVRAKEAHRAEVRERRREYAQNPNVQYGRWHDARQRALAEMRAERRQGRIVAGIEPGAVSAQHCGWCDEYAALAEQAAGVIDHQLDALRFAFNDFAQAVAQMAQGLAQICAMPPSPPKDTDLAQLASLLTNAGWVVPEPTPAPAQRPARYLPGTRHAGGGHGPINLAVRRGGPCNPPRMDAAHRRRRR